MDFDVLANSVSGVALTLPRIAAAFVMLPLISNDTMPPLVRNSFFVSLAIVAFPFAAAAAPLDTVRGAMWISIILKEMLIGLCIGFLFGIVFWAIGAVGNIIDAKVGSTIATVIDPLQGHQTSLTGAFLSRLAGWVFMATGGFLVFLDLLLGSYALWPVTSDFPSMSAASETLFVQSFARLMTLSLLLAAPALIVLMLVDLCAGLINRYAQQLNVLALSLSIKSWIATWIVLLCLGMFVETLVRHIRESSGLLDVLGRVLF
jgi:type III secretion protein T